MNPPNNAQVEQARMNLATAQAAIVTNSAILEAAGLAVVPTPAAPMEISAVGLKLRQSGSSTVRDNFDYIGLCHSRLCSTIACTPCLLISPMS